MPTPTLTSACEYASGNASKASSAMYLRYFIVKPPFRPLSAIRGCDSPSKALQLFLFSSEAPTYLNSDRVEKLRVDEWLISAILREINHLGRNGWSGSLKHPGLNQRIRKRAHREGSGRLSGEGDACGILFWFARQQQTIRSCYDFRNDGHWPDDSYFVA